MGSLGPTTATVIMTVAKAAPAGVVRPKGGAKNGVAAAAGDRQQQQQGHRSGGCGFQMPLHYPRYKKADYEAMPEWRVDCLLREYGLPVAGDLDAKRSFAMGAFLWPDQY